MHDQLMPDQQFTKMLYELRINSGRPIKKAPRVGGSDVDLFQLFAAVHKLGGFNKVTNWRKLAE